MDFYRYIHHGEKRKAAIPKTKTVKLTCPIRTPGPTITRSPKSQFVRLEWAAMSQSSPTVTPSLIYTNGPILHRAPSLHRGSTYAVGAIAFEDVPSEALWKYRRDRYSKDDRCEQVRAVAAATTKLCTMVDFTGQE